MNLVHVTTAITSYYQSRTDRDSITALDRTLFQTLQSDLSGRVGVNGAFLYATARSTFAVTDGQGQAQSEFALFNALPAITPAAFDGLLGEILAFANQQITPQALVPPAPATPAVPSPAPPA